MARGRLIAKADELIRRRPKSTIKVYSDKLKAVKDMKVNDTVTLVVTAKVKSLYAGDSPYYDEYSDDEEGRKTLCATLQVQDVKEK